MEWLLDPTIWVGLLTLVVLEIVLGIDNLIFIAILADKLPPKERDRARIIGLSLALLMRLALLSGISWLFQLTAPLLTVGDMTLSGKDLILIIGGFFLLFKGTLELHERIEGKRATFSGAKVYASFGVVVTQIVVLDAVFSLDAVITAVGMVEHLPVMMAAVIIAMLVMLVASKPLTKFVGAHPTVVVLCLGFLLMIGFSLVVEGFGFSVPKGYLYAAIGFSILIEFFNQLARRNLLALDSTRPMRERTAEAVLRMLGKKLPDEPTEEIAEKDRQDQPISFGIEERNMVSGVLTLADRSVHSIMTPRTDVSWIDIDDDPVKIREQIEQAPHSFFPVCRGTFDQIIGIGRAKRMIADLLTHGRIQENRLREPLIVHDTISIIRLIDTLKHSKGQLVLVADEFGAIEGLVTPIDVFEAIAGEFPDEDESPDIVADGENRWRVDGAADLHLLEQVLDTDGLVNEDEEYSTLAGYLLNHFGRLPNVGDRCEFDAAHAVFSFEVVRLERRRIAMVHVEKHPKADGESTGAQV
ncbi:TerC family protein [Orrella daihaiensis]|uniref:TerC family protein n=1 Tax=Orrella daihaiensis TaxID=2782176 RepID=A0ABY4ALY4_9BURK|nr:TerC family protein [Orrella daihaiensis]UOD51174.1 TerC family protein [Orrella daihaiensis]